MEIENRAEEWRLESAASVNVPWLLRGGHEMNSRLVETVEAIPAPKPATLVFVAAESSIVHAIRRPAAQAWALEQECLYLAGYWKRGAADHRDEGKS